MEGRASAKSWSGDESSACLRGSGGPPTPQIPSPGSCVPLLPLSKHQDRAWILCLQAGALILGGLSCCPSLCEISLADGRQGKPPSQRRQVAEPAPNTTPSVPDKAFSASRGTTARDSLSPQKKQKTATRHYSDQRLKNSMMTPGRGTAPQRGLPLHPHTHIHLHPMLCAVRKRGSDNRKSRDTS